MWLTAVILGFAGSLHCVGMCSPLVMAVTAMKPGALINRIIYNSGRILSYGMAGAVISTAGMLLPLADYQNIISILLGIALLLTGLGTIKHFSVPILTASISKASVFLKNRFSHHLKQKTRGAMFLLGCLNGLLPCGLTFIALTWCLTLQGPVDGFNFMVLFGLGTLPVMLGLTSLFPLLAGKFNMNLQKLTTSMLIFSGVALIVRVFIIHVPHASTDSGLVEILMCR